MNEIKVSVCIPVYNVEKYIAQCVHSLMKQTISGLELIFVDDCSPDNSIQVLEETLKEYKRDDIVVKIIRHEKNMGVTRSRLDAMAAVTGEYFIHCDPDDEVEHCMYQTMYDRVKTENADMVYCDFCHVYADGSIKEKIEKDVEKAKDMIGCILDYNCTCWGSLCNKLWKSSLKSGVECPDNIIFREDDRLSIQMLTKCDKIVHVASIFYKYYCNPGSICTGRKEVHFYCSVQNMIFYRTLLTEIDFLKYVLPGWQLLMVSSIRNGEKSGKKLFEGLTENFKIRILNTPNDYMTENDFTLLKLGLFSWTICRWMFNLYSMIHKVFSKKK